MGQISEFQLKDMALVRLGGQVYFLSDIENLQSSFKALRCLGGNSYIEKFLVSSPEPLVNKVWAELSKVDSLPKQLSAFILIEKLKLSSVSSSSTLNMRVSSLELSKLNSECSRISWEKLSSEEKSLFVSEIYLRQRFSTSKDLNSSLTEFIKNLNIQHNHELLRLRPSEQSVLLMNKSLPHKASDTSEESHSISKDEK